jgi:creatinine amidohydrolase
MSDVSVAVMTWDKVGERLADGAPAILPVGAGAKQHGLHMPMASDLVLAEHLAGTLARQVGGLVWPTLAYGHYPAFERYAGSISLQAATFEALVAEIVDGLLRSGARRVAILDTGLSTLAPIRRAVDRCKQPAAVHHLSVFSGRCYTAAARSLQRQVHGSHADELETSLMLAVAPSLVDMSRAEASPPLSGPPQEGPLDPVDPASPNHSRSGSFGDPTLASLDKGRRLLAAIEQDLREAAAQIA